MKQALFIAVVLSYLFPSCVPAGQENEEAPMYASYQVWGEEDQENVNCFFQFRPSPGSRLTLEPGKVMLDREVLKADSTPLTGIYYESEKPLTGFSGEHTIVFTDNNNKQYTETFEYKPFRLLTDLPDVVPRKDITLELVGVNQGDTIRLVIIDTSFNTNSINELEAVTDDRIHISRDLLNKVASGPITLQLIKEEERPVKDPPKNGGLISISYGLTRDLELRD